MRGYLDLLEQLISPETETTALGYLREAQEASERMERMIVDLLEYSRLESQARAPEAFDAGLAVEDALANVGAAVRESGAQIVVGVMPMVFGDRGQLTRVFQNLVANAVKFSGKGVPHVVIDAEVEETMVRFRVRDDGIGFDPRHSPRLFGAFQRLHGSSYKGTGIGLASCKRIVERHGGRIWADSKPGEGATFTFTFPRQGDAIDA